MERQLGALKARNDELTGQLNEARDTISRVRKYAKRLKKQQGKANRDLSRWYCVLTTNRELHAQHRTILVFMLRVMLGRFSLPKLTRDLKGKCSSEDAATLHRHATGTSHNRRIRAFAVIFHLCGVPQPLVAEILPVFDRTIKKYLRVFHRGGVEQLFRPTKRSITRKSDDPQYKEAIFSLLHSPPADYGFNRTTWRRKDLHTVMARNGMLVGHNYIDKIINDAGYRFLKAREVLTSNDPQYREKVDRIKQVLSKLTRTQRFFSIDEFGPVSIKQRGGRRLVRPGEYPTVPQFQHSKGWLIVTAALELSTNQVAHFYSKDKNTQEMIKLLELLLRKYQDCSHLFFSWDAASWHSSKRFKRKVAEVNSHAYRREHKTPRVELTPLPACAQFLNVIESVFSGLAVSVIHNSDYQSVDEAKRAIDRYFKERNAHFRKHPKRAGKKIWGNERVPSRFEEHHNCKNERFR